MPKTPELVAAVVFVVTGLWALFQANSRQVDVVTFTVADTWALDHRCRAIRHLLLEGPAPRRVEIDLGDFFIADRSAISLLVCTRRRLEDADVALSIVAGPAVEGLLIASGLPASSRRAADEARCSRNAAN